MHNPIAICPANKGEGGVKNGSQQKQSYSGWQQIVDACTVITTEIPPDPSQYTV
jgi:hypothetical protein